MVSSQVNIGDSGKTQDSINGRKRTRHCGVLNMFFFSCQICMVMLFFFVQAKTLHPKNENTSFSATAQRQHFINSLGSYTALRTSLRRIASDSFMRATGFPEYPDSLYKFFFHDYLAFHRKNRRRSKRRLIFRPQGSGLGDRFGCLVFAYWAAVVTNRIFIVDWKHPYPLDIFMHGANDLDVFLKKNDWLYDALHGREFYHNQTTDVIVLTNYRAVLNKYEHFLVSNISTVVLNTNRVPPRFSESSIKAFKRGQLDAKDILDLRGTVDFHRAVLHHFLGLNRRMRADIRKMSSSLNLFPGPDRQKGNILQENSQRRLGLIDKKKRPYIGVHARIGVGVGEEGTRFKEVATQMKAAARCLGSRAIQLSFMSGSPPLPIFLATDTPEFRDIFKAQVRRISQGRVEVLYGNWNIVHLARLRNHRKKKDDDANKTEKEDWEAMWSSFVDVIMLGHAEHIVALYSSFPRLAQGIGDAESLVELRNEICLRSEDWTSP